MTEGQLPKLLKYFIVGVSALLAIFFGGAYILPSEWQVHRSVIINASPEQIYPYVSNLKVGWPQWSAFEYADPDIRYEYEGAEEGVGARRSWVSDRMGDGSQLITKSDPRTGVEFQLEMREPYVVFNGKVTFSSNSNNSTEVTWTDWGTVGLNPMHRWMFFFLDSMVGSSFEKSLTTLKAKVEARNN